MNIKFVEWDIDNFETIEKNISGIDCIIYLCGILFENKDGDFYKVHSKLPAYLGKISSQKKINTLKKHNVKLYKVNINKDGSFNLKDLLAKVKKLNFSRIMIESGIHLIKYVYFIILN